MGRINSILEEHKIAIALSLVGIILIVGGFFSSGLNDAKPTYAETTSAKTESAAIVKVDVSGAVKNPAVYTLNSSSRVEDAISAAGGFSDGANQDYISKTLNLSQKLTDGQKIYIPFEGDNSAISTAGGTSSGSTLVSLNSGSETELESLPGVGPATAQKIIDGRPYSDISDLTLKKVVTQSIYSKIKGLVEVN